MGPASARFWPLFPVISTSARPQYDPSATSPVLAPLLSMAWNSLKVADVKLERPLPPASRTASALMFSQTYPDGHFSVTLNLWLLSLWVRSVRARFQAPPTYLTSMEIVSPGLTLNWYCVP